MVSYKTLNKDNSKLNCRLKGFNNYSPKRIILDNKLKIKINSYVLNTANKHNTIIFYNQADKSKVLNFKNKKIKLIRSKINKKGKFDIKVILKKLYKLDCRNLLIEGGDSLTNHLLKRRIFNKFYLYKSPKNLPKKTEYLKFSSLDVLKKKYKEKLNLNLFLGKDKITLYKR
jgi:diaminohydroxyphosphoribosylaminopyrimidine deaminase/5-amino-6-(5-phosphoribosylamino)uracil reductase